MLLKRWNGTTWESADGSVPPGTFARGDETPTLDELIGAQLFPDVAVANSFTAFIAQTPTKLATMSLVNHTAIAASDTNYWTITIRRYRPAGAGTPDVVATKTTKVTGGEAIGVLTDWNFDAIPFANNTLAKGDIITVAFVPTGSPTALGRPAISYRYVPL